jgi:3-hydroxyisobutyrate dehydrogenase-like beta-hydroxyacid dehydrogenase
VTGVTIGLLHPGEMGAAMGSCLTGRGHAVLWASEGRGPDTVRRAEAAGLRDVRRVAELASQAAIIVSVCPPHAAVELARQVADVPAGSAAAVYVDANAISPATAREVARIAEAGNRDYVDGAIIGPPPSAPGDTRLYLSGQRAPLAGELFDGTALKARFVEGSTGAASAVKMAYAAWTKGTAALVLAARALARAEGVERALLDEWTLSQPGLADRTKSAARSAAAKGWRWVAEMEQIAESMAAAGLPPGFHAAAAEIFGRPPRDAAATADAATLDLVLEALLPR